MAIYNQNYTKNEIQRIINRIKNSVKQNHYMISLNDHRQENKEFIELYQLHSMKQKKILLHLKIEDFCYSTRNYHTTHQDEILYIFAPNLILWNIQGYQETINVYIKINIVPKMKKKQVIIISFHPNHQQANYLFKKEDVSNEKLCLL